MQVSFLDFIKLEYDINSLDVFIYSYEFELYACMLYGLEKSEKGDCQIYNVCLWA